jgi:hypothetical protein
MNQRRLRGYRHLVWVSCSDNGDHSLSETSGQLKRLFIKDYLSFQENLQYFNLIVFRETLKLAQVLIKDKGSKTLL